MRDPVQGMGTQETGGNQSERKEKETSSILVKQSRSCRSKFRRELKEIGGVEFPESAEEQRLASKIALVKSQRGEEVRGERRA